MKLRLLLPLLLLCLVFTTFAEGREWSAQVTRIEDGDSLLIDGDQRIRLLGIDAPERIAGGRDRFYLRQGVTEETLRRTSRDAILFLNRNVLGKSVRLVTGGDERDGYGRILAYLFLDDRLINLEMVEKGLAAVFRKYDFNRKGSFLEAERRARKSEIGLWEPSSQPQPDNATAL